MSILVKRYVHVQGDIVVSGVSHYGSRVGGARRGNVSYLSEGSRTRMGKYLRCCSADYRSMVTLTWPRGAMPDRDVSRSAFRKFLERLRRYWGSGGQSGWSAFWFREFTEAGTCHYHLFVTHWIGKAWLSHAWWEACGKISMQHLRAGTQICRWRGGKKALRSYASKYATKIGQKIAPKFFKKEKEGEASKSSAGRFWGIFGIRTQNQLTAVFKFSKIFNFFENDFSKFINFWIFELENLSFAKKLKSKSDFVDIWVIKRGEKFGQWWRGLKEYERQWEENRQERLSIQWA